MGRCEPTMTEPTMIERNMAKIKHKNLVLSGKGGVGKSTTCCNIAQCFVAQGLKVGVLDIDICGPSVPMLLGLEDREVMQSSDGWVPVFADQEQRLCCMSIGFLLKSRDAPVIFRGPKKTGLLRNFLADTMWGELDVLLVDSPPGTSDEHISTLEMLQGCSIDGAVIVTTPQVTPPPETLTAASCLNLLPPQEVALADVRKEIGFCQQFGVPVLGLVENMSGFVCPHCKDCTDIFLSGGGEKLAAQYGIPMLGRIPIDPTLGQSCEKGLNFIASSPDSQATEALVGIAAKLSAEWGSDSVAPLLVNQLEQAAQAEQANK